MGADNVLVKGARDAYKNRDAAGMKEAGQGLDKITSAVNEWAVAKKEQKTKEFNKLKQDKERDIAQKDITKRATEMADSYKSLGQEEFGVWKDDVRGLIEEMNAALEPPRDEEAIMDINMRLGELKSKGMKAKDGYEAIMDGWQADEKTGEPAWDTKAMTEEGLSAHQNFMKNPSRRFVRNEDGEDAYQWDVLDDNGEPVQKTTPAGDPMTDGYGQPIYETQTYTLDELNDFTALPETENGMAYMDLITEKKQLFSDTQGEIKVEDLRKQVGDMIPKNEKALRSWAKSNPTEDTNLDVYGYLLDHPLLNKGNYKDLGVTDKNGDGVIDEFDVVSAEDKEAIVESIMNADDPEITHEVLTDIYTDIGYKSIHGEENKDDTKLMSGEVNVEDIKTKLKGAKVDGMKNLIEKGPEEGDNLATITRKLNLSPEDLESGITINGKLMKVSSVIADAVKKKAGVSSDADIDALIEKHSK